MSAVPQAPPLAARWLAYLGVAGALFGALAWIDAVPGGWTLRNRFETPLDRRARTAALHASERLHVFQTEDPAANEGAVVFVGASNIERLSLAELFPGKRTLNRGIAGATAEELARYLAALALPAHPAGIVIHAGANDWRALGLAPDAIAPRVERLVEGVAARAPAAPILLLGLLPERGAGPEFARDRAEIDEGLAAVAARARGNGHRAVFLKLARPPLSSTDGSLVEEFSSDREHLNADGARQLARWITTEGGAVGRFLAP